jgi:hypothetical protein
VTGAAAVISILPAWLKFKLPKNGSEEKVISEEQVISEQ